MELEDNKTEQPVTDSTVTDNQPKTDDKDSIMNQKVTLSDGEEVSVEELKNGYMRHSDYTKKTQALSKQKREYSEDDKKAMNLLKEAWFATVEDIEAFKKDQSAREEFESFKHNFSTLGETQIKAIKDLRSANPDKSLEDIAKSYGFIDEANLQRAKWTPVRGESIGVPQPEKKEVFTMKWYKWNFKDTIEKYWC